MSVLRRRPSESTYARVVRCGITAEIAGVLLFSVIIFTTVPIVLTLCMCACILLIAVGLLVWVWSFIWGRI